MRGRFYCFLVLFLNVVSLVEVSSSRPLAPNDGFAFNNQGTISSFLPLQISRSSNKAIKNSMGIVDEARVYKEINKIGSNPPSCEHKCYGCMPCEAIQVPTTTNRLRVQYTNYEPEAWNASVGLPSTAHNKTNQIQPKLN